MLWIGSGGGCTACPSAGARRRRRRSAPHGVRRRRRGRGRRHQRAGPRRHPHRQRPRPARRRARGLADRVEAHEREPHSLALDDRRPARLRQVARRRRTRAIARRRRTRAPSRPAPCCRSRRRGCWPATARRTRRRRSGPSSAGVPPNESPPWVGSPFVESVLSRLPTVMSADRSRRRSGASAAAASGTPRTSIRSPTTVSVIRGGGSGSGDAGGRVGRTWTEWRSTPPRAAHQPGPGRRCTPRPAPATPPRPVPRRHEVSCGHGTAEVGNIRRDLVVWQA